jgi:outer membrane protein TolC
MLEEMSLLKQQEVSRLSRSAANVEELFLSGRCTYLEIYTAQANYLKTQIELLNIQQMCYFNEIKLYKAMGGAWR